MKGTVNSISVSGMLRLLCSYKKTGILNVDNEKVKGFIHLHNGEITHVEASGSNEIKQALNRLLLVVEEGSFYFEDRQDVKTQPLGLSVENVIMESSRFIEGVNEDISEYLLPGREVLKISTLPRNKMLSVNFLDHEWNLLVSFDGNNNIDHVFGLFRDNLRKSQSALYGLVAAGLLKRTRFKTPEIGKIAAESLGSIGLAIVDSEFKKHSIDRNRMGMKEMITLLNSLENSFSEIVGKTKSRQVIEKIWESSR